MMRRLLRLALIAGIATASVPVAARSQLSPGDTVRLSVANLEVRRGVFVRADREAVYLRMASDSVPARIPYSEFTRAEVRTPLPIGREPVSQASDDGWRAVDIRRFVELQAGSAAVHAPSDTARRDRAEAALSIPRRSRTPWEVVVGDTVRLSSTQQGVVRGVLVSVDTDALVVADAEHESVRVARSGPTTAEVLRGRRRRGAEAVGTGALVGAGVGVALFAASASSRDSGGIGVVFGVLLGATSTIVGTLVGGLFGLTDTEQWLRFDIATLWLLPGAQ